MMPEIIFRPGVELFLLRFCEFIFPQSEEILPEENYAFLRHFDQEFSGIFPGISRGFQAPYNNDACPHRRDQPKPFSSQPRFSRLDSPGSEATPKNTNKFALWPRSLGLVGARALLPSLAPPHPPSLAPAAGGGVPHRPADDDRPAPPPAPAGPRLHRCRRRGPSQRPRPLPRRVDRRPHVGV